MAIYSALSFTPYTRLIYGGQADPSREFTQKALDTCKCASGIDVYGYHTYPGYGQNMNPGALGLRRVPE